MLTICRLGGIDFFVFTLKGTRKISNYHLKVVSYSERFVFADQQQPNRKRWGYGLADGCCPEQCKQYNLPRNVGGSVMVSQYDKVGLCQLL